VSSSTGYNGSAESREITVKEIAVGSLRVAALKVLVFAKGGGRDARAWSLNVGNAFLKAWVVTLDYPGKTVTLAKP
jgi:hypothetical protein